MLDSARPCDVRQGNGALWRDDKRGGDFPALAEIPCAQCARSLGRHTPLAFLPAKILRADRARFRVGKARQVAQAHAKTRKAVIIRQVSTNLSSVLARCLRICIRSNGSSPK